MRATEAVDALIAHIEEHEFNRQRAKDFGQRSYKPSAEEKAERDRLLKAVIWAFQLTRRELLAKLDIDRATWDRWRIMKTIPQADKRNALRILALNVGEFPTAAEQPKEAETILAALGITAEQLKQLEWLKRVQNAAGFELSESICRLLVQEFQASQNSSSS